jgi:hypothetical protein
MSKIELDLLSYEAHITEKLILSLAKKMLFSDYNRLNYDKTKICFNIDPDQVKLLFPFDYEVQLAHLQQLEKEGK